LGAALAGQQRWTEAAESFRMAAMLSPGNPNVIRSLGVAQGLAGQFRAAAIHLRASLLQDPEDHELRYLLAYVSWRQGDVATAVEQLEVLLEARPDHRKARLLLEKLRE
jgi:cytochrome c-type biogenesis protein CcmH/NrfG